ncbi:MAG: protein translocase subunit SecF [Ilumatobacteraceae bacterium]|nr:protein translocase subunit SecF [Ilumatobacteraceae bacterium]
MSGRLRRLYRGETTVDFYGRRKFGFALSLLIGVITVVSLISQGINLGIDFKGGVAWEVPASKTFGVDEARATLTANSVTAKDAKIQTLTSGIDRRIRIQVGDQPTEKIDALKQAFAKDAGVDADQVSVAAVSSTWGRSITEKALRALIVFFALVSLYIAFRFEWKMALAAIIAMVHDVLVSVGVYSLLGLEVTPATVVAFLTILGFSLYDTIVVFDKVQENNERFKTTRASYGDIVNVSMNQVLMRSLNTSIAAILPVLSLLVLGSWVMGAVALQEFAVALLVGLITGAYSSIYIATPLLGMFKEREPKFASLRGQRALGEEMTRLILTGAVSGRRATAQRSEVSGDTEPGGQGSSGQDLLTAASVLSHPPRPRKKGRR